MTRRTITALIDCLGRKGNAHLSEAEQIYLKYAPPKYTFKLPALFSSSRIHNDIERGRRLFEKMRAILSNHKNANGMDAFYTNYASPMDVMLCNIYGMNVDILQSV